MNEDFRGIAVITFSIVIVIVDFSVGRIYLILGEIR